MARVVHKWNLYPGPNSLPPGLPVLVAHQPGHDMPTIWLEYDPAAPVQANHYYEFVGTGHNVPGGGEHVGSCVIGPFVWHVYRSHH